MTDPDAMGPMVQVIGTGSWQQRVYASALFALRLRVKADRKDDERAQRTLRRYLARHLRRRGYRMGNWMELDWNNTPMGRVVWASCHAIVLDAESERIPADLIDRKAFVTIPDFTEMKWTT